MSLCATCVGCRSAEDDGLFLVCPDCYRGIHDDDWCYGHMRPEPWVVGAYTCCGECFHVFLTAGDLLALHNEVLAEFELPPETSVDEIFCCPVCAHDF